MGYYYYYYYTLFPILGALLNKRTAIPTPVWCNAEGHVRIWNFKRGFRVRFRSAAEKTKKLVGRRDRDLADLSSGFEVRFRREEDS